MSQRITWIPAKMFFPPDVNPADIDWCEPLNSTRNTSGATVELPTNDEPHASEFLCRA